MTHEITQTLKKGCGGGIDSLRHESGRCPREQEVTSLGEGEPQRRKERRRRRDMEWGGEEAQSEQRVCENARMKHHVVC